MSPRRRTGKSRGLPDNLFATTTRGKTYYRYKRPDTGEWRGAGADRQAAIRAAKRANAQLDPDANASESAFERLMADPGITIETLADRFKKHLREVTDKKGRRRADKTLYEYDRMIDRAVTEWAGRDADGIRRGDVTALLEQYSGRSYGAYRTVLYQLFAYHVSTSDRDDNPVAGTLTKPHVVARQRLTWDEYRTIHEHAPQWLRNAMDLSLRSLQARAEIVALRFDDEREPGFLFVDRAKVERHESGHIRIKIGPGLREAIQNCRDSLVSPFMVHRKPDTRRRAAIANKAHWTQITPDYLSKAFAKARDAAGIRPEIDRPQRPSFHEIRSLGGDLLIEAGWSKEAVRRLYGHTSERMTDVYIDRRGRETRYTDAEAG